MYFYRIMFDVKCLKHTNYDSTAENLESISMTIAYKIVTFSLKRVSESRVNQREAREHMFHKSSSKEAHIS